MAGKFRLRTRLKPKGDQPQAIKKLADGVLSGEKFQTLLGVTGSGKTFTMANIIQKVQRPTLVIAPNKTLAAQLFQEFSELFPENAVEYFVSYYDYYQPEAYLPQTNTYIEKDASINEEIDRLRNSATRSIIDRRDVIIVASVSCIYGLGRPKDYLEMSVPVKVGRPSTISRDELLKSLVRIQYNRTPSNLSRGTFRARGAIVDVMTSYDEEGTFMRVSFNGENEDVVESIERINALSGKAERTFPSVRFYPAKHHVVPRARIEAALKSIKEERKVRLAQLQDNGQLLEAQRLAQRTNFDLEMMDEMGYCSGIENYSRHFDGRSPGTPPSTLMDFFPEDSLFFIDESHVTIPQLRGMYLGDLARKKTLVEYGFRLPCAFDNRPLRFSEFLKKVSQTIFVSATPTEYEVSTSQGRVVEQIIRPTGLVDPKVCVRPVEGQIDDLLKEIKKRVKRKERVLVTTLTKRMAEDLSDFLAQSGIRTKYLHSDIKTLDRVEILRDLRLGEFDVLVGINLLREGLDLPEASLVAIMDADREGFLRSETALVQTMGRVSRNAVGEVILYAERETGSMKRAMTETRRRRKRQLAHNKKHGITPKTIRKRVSKGLLPTSSKGYSSRAREEDFSKKNLLDIEELRYMMRKAAERLDFETAAKIRDMINERGTQSALSKSKSKRRPRKRK